MAYGYGSASGSNALGSYLQQSGYNPYGSAATGGFISSAGSPYQSNKQAAATTGATYNMSNPANTTNNFTYNIPAMGGNPTASGYPQQQQAAPVYQAQPMAYDPYNQMTWNNAQAYYKNGQYVGYGANNWGGYGTPQYTSNTNYMPISSSSRQYWGI